MGQTGRARLHATIATPIHPQRAAHEIDTALPEDAILVSDIGVHHNWLLRYCQPRGLIR